MKVNSIKFRIDSGISIYCKSTEEEYSSLQHAIVNYDISIINAPYQKVQEQCKIYKKNIQFQHPYFILFFPLDNIINPHESQISIKYISFFLTGNKRVNFTINKTFSFKELQKNVSGKSINTTTIGKLHDTYQENLQNLQKGGLSSQKKGPSAKHNISPSTKVEETKLFVDSLKKFRAEVRGSNLENLIKSKCKAMDFNLKSFGISILCKLLLLTKYVNNLVDNDFQEDLTKFVALELANEKLSEVLT
ncbi:hypothetical protein LCGC14_1428140 [marine sediment metagenome]|uniref:Uncharacterized protein n=1 Tax=marine sediment metagenome TaxID=412755 RepID=A0A0F9M4V1_9ZZZZ